MFVSNKNNIIVMLNVSSMHRDVNRNNVNRLYIDRNITHVNKMPGTTRIVINV